MTNNNGGVLYTRLKPAGHSASNCQPGYEINNAFDPNPSLVFKSSENSVTIQFYYSTSVVIEGLALIYHTIPENSTIIFRKCNAGYIPILPYDIPNETKNTYILMDNQPYGYYELFISAANPFQIGCIFPAKTAFQFPQQYTWTYKKKFVVQKTVDTTDEGYHLETPGEDEDPPLEYLEFNLSFKDVEDIYYPDYCNLIRVGSKVFIPFFSDNICYYGIVPNTELDADVDSSGGAFNLNFKEHALPPIGESQ